MGGLGHARALGSGTLLFLGLGLGHALECAGLGLASGAIFAALRHVGGNALGKTFGRRARRAHLAATAAQADAHTAAKTSCGMTTTRLERIDHRGELKEHRAGKDHDDSQDNHLAHRQVGNRKQLRESDNAHQDAGDYKHKEHHT